MAQKEIEIILSRQLASYLATPIFIVDPAGNLLYYNEPAEGILGLRYAETGEMPLSEWSTIFVPKDQEGAPLLPEALPLVVALTEHQPSQRDFWIHGLDGTSRHIEVVAYPLIGQAGRNLGAVAVFWEMNEHPADEAGAN